MLMYFNGFLCCRCRCRVVVVPFIDFCKLNTVYRQCCAIHAIHFFTLFFSILNFRGTKPEYHFVILTNIVRIYTNVYVYASQIQVSMHLSISIKYTIDLISCSRLGVSQKLIVSEDDFEHTFRRRMSCTVNCTCELIGLICFFSFRHCCLACNRDWVSWFDRNLALVA